VRVEYPRRRGEKYQRKPKHARARPSREPG
jgi:hypothetical protein